MANSCCAPDSAGTPVEPKHENPFVKKLKDMDRVVIAFILTWIAIAVAAPDQSWSSIEFVGKSLWEIAPYLAISVAFAAYIKATGADSLIGNAFRANAGKAVMVAAIVGAFSPFCSCGVVPLIAALLASGVPIAPVMAFWLASPVIDPEMMLVTAGILGPEFAAAKTVAAVSLGLMGGYSTALIQKLGGFSDPLLIEVNAGCGAGAITRTEKPVWAFWKEDKRRNDFFAEGKSTSWFLFKWLSIAFMLEGIMIANVPMDIIGEWLANTGSYAIPMAAIIGAPAYLNGYAAIPLADTLMQLGLQPGAALAFMVAGGATCIPAAVAVKALTKTPLFLTFIAIALFGSMVIGYGFNIWLSFGFI
ncbi:permease [Curvivirga aplysinae]|uniref:permease n=1 Tax=Curvivirga aplysinae TaxID=2529852 RepID=UPI001F2C87BE|nr:permease [Curvivirga aplysinae]